ncbi:MAG: stage V sporulation T C-terminal domain-containing protein [Christensenellaceae bacterium]
MKETGIVRRIDELGRVVIPKEIRKTLRFKEGDPLEIFTDNDSLIFQKYSALATLKDSAENLVKSLFEYTNKNVVVTDLDKVVSVKGKAVKDICDKEISSELETVLKERKSRVFNANQGEQTVNLIKDEKTDCCSQLIVPILVGGDIFGGLILMGCDKNDEIDAFDTRLMQFCGDYLATELE